MSSLAILKLTVPPPATNSHRVCAFYPPPVRILSLRPRTLAPFSDRRRGRRTGGTLVCPSSRSFTAELSAADEEWLKKLPDKKKPLYSHSLPCIEAWLRSLGFYQSRDDREVWFVEKPDWHAQLSLDITDLYIKYLKSGPGNLEKDKERRFNYALSREDIEKAILIGP